MNSVEITRYLYEKNFISKEAALRILKSRRDFVKTATEDIANEVFGFKKSAGIFGNLLSRQPIATQVAEAAPKGIIGPAAKRILPLLGVAGLIALGTTASKLGLGLASDIKMDKEVKKSYAQMFKEYPELKDDKATATKFFNMMAKFAPVLASNPVVAGTWVKGTMDQNLVGPQNIGQLIEIQNQWEDIRATKSPLMGLANAMPDTKSLFGHALATD